MVTEPHWEDQGNYAGWVEGCDSQGDIVEYQWYNQWGQIRVIEGTWGHGTNLCEGWLSINFGNKDPKPGTAKSFKLVVIDKKGHTSHDWVTYTLGEPEEENPGGEDPLENASIVGGFRTSYVHWFDDLRQDIATYSLDDVRWYIHSQLVGDHSMPGFATVTCHIGEYFYVDRTSVEEEGTIKEGCAGYEEVGEMVVLISDGTWVIRSSQSGQKVATLVPVKKGDEYAFFGVDSVP